MAHRSEILILLLAAGLRLYKLDSLPVWCDEADFWEMANHQGWIATLLHIAAESIYPPLFYLIQHALGFFSRETYWLRLPSALAGIAAVWVLMRLLRRCASVRAATYGGLLAALSPVMIAYAQEAKLYAFLALLLLLVLDETLRVLEEPGRGWKRLALWATLSAYTFYLSFIFFVSLLLSVAWICRQNLKQAEGVWKGYAVAALLFLPWSPFFFKTIAIHRGSAFNFQAERLLLYSFQNFSIGFWTTGWLEWVGVALFALAAWLGLRSICSARDRHLAWILAACTFLPLILSWVISLTVKPMYSDRAMLASAFGWKALAALGAASSRRLHRLGAGLLVSVQALALIPYYTDPQVKKVDYKPAWNYVTTHWQSGDTIFHVSIASYWPFRLYARQEQARGEKSHYQDESGAALGLRPNWIYTPPPEFLSSAAAEYYRAIWRRFNVWLKQRGRDIYTGYNRNFVYGERLVKEALPGVRRIWYLNTDKDASLRVWMPQKNVYKHGIECWWPLEPQKMPWLSRRFELKSTTRVTEVDIYLYELKPSAFTEDATF